VVVGLVAGRELVELFSRLSMAGRLGLRGVVNDGSREF
jgi:hypothetical protein